MAKASAEATLQPAELRGRRRALGLTQAGLAKWLGVTANTVARWERAEQRVRDPGRVAWALDRLEEWSAREPLDAAQPRSELPGNKVGADDARAERPERRGNLPADVSSFVGRQQEIDSLLARLSTTNLLTLVGPGGVGKTRLALRLALAAQNAYAHGTWLVDLTQVDDGASIPVAVAAVLGIHEQPGLGVVEVLMRSLHRRSLLLILDNCEHLVEGCAALAEALLKACTGVTLLVTSRQRLGVASEVVWRVKPLSLPDLDSEITPGRLGASDAARLFVERCQAIRAGFVLTDVNAGPIARICHYLDGMPLSLELASAKIALCSPAQIEQRLGACFELLEDDDRRPRRHRTLREVFDWSHQLLTVREQMLFRRLAVFNGGWSLEAAERVCGGPDLSANDLFNTLHALVAKSLVQVTDGDALDERRFTYQEMLRQYGLEKLRATGEESTMRHKHVGYYLDLAQRAEPRLWCADQLVWFNRLTLEHDNLRAAMTHSAQSAETDTTLALECAEQGLRLASALWRFWDWRGHASEGRKHLRDLLAAAPHCQPLVRARALHAAAYLAYIQGDLQFANDTLQEVVPLARRVGDTFVLGFALNAMGMLEHTTGHVDAAAALFNEGLAVAQASGDRVTASFAFLQLAETDRIRGEYTAANVWYEQSLAIAREQGDRWRAAYVLNGLGRNALAIRQPRRATVFFRESLRLRSELGDVRAAAESIEALAGVAAARHQRMLMVRLLAAAHGLRERTGAAPEPQFHREHAQAVASARRKLRAKAFDLAWEEGRTMIPAAAIAYGLEDRPSPEASEGESGGPSKQSHNIARSFEPAARLLTPRERDVATLVAQGLTNRDIAEALSIAERTVETHLEHIFARLDFHSRAQLMRWLLRIVPSQDVESGLVLAFDDKTHR